MRSERHSPRPGIILSKAYLTIAPGIDRELCQLLERTYYFCLPGSPSPCTYHAPLRRKKTSMPPSSGSRPGTAGLVLAPV